MKIIIPILGSTLLLQSSALATRLAERVESFHDLVLNERRAALTSLSNPFGTPAPARIVAETPKDPLHGKHPWKRRIVATIFWVGEEPTDKNPTPNHMSAWDTNWEANFGGFDDPKRRNGWGPAQFTPKLNPFYVALPYNDVAKGGIHQPEASKVIPWFWEDFRAPGISVCKSKWVAIHYEGQVCYAQWKDVGPFVTDHWQYVFGPQKPRANRNQGAGIDLSPAIRDFFQLKSDARVEWRFVDDHLVPHGPWKDWTGEGGLPDF